MPTDYEDHYEWRLNQYKKEGKTLLKCPSCEREFPNRGITTHWKRSSCPTPEPTEYQLDLLTGILMGDGSVKRQPNTSHIVIKMIAPEFLAWVDEQLGVFSTGVRRIKATSITPNMKDYSYELNVRSLPSLYHFAEWYGPDGKRFPDDLSLTPTIFKMWYVCDGSVCKSGNDNWRNRIQLSVSNECDREDYLVNLFEDIGLSPTLSHHILRFNADDSEQALEYMGSPPPGFAYKWKLSN